MVAIKCRSAFSFIMPPSFPLSQVIFFTLCVIKDSVALIFMEYWDRGIMNNAVLRNELLEYRSVGALLKTLARDD